MNYRALKKSLANHWWLIVMQIVFSLAGLTVGYCARFAWNTEPGLAVGIIIFGLLFILGGGALAFLNLSSIRYYYEAAVIQMEGIRIFGRVTKKFVEDDTWNETDEDNQVHTEEEKIYWLEWNYEYSRNGKLEKFEGAADISEREYQAFNEGDKIPLRILPNRPEKSFPVFP